MNPYVQTTSQMSIWRDDANAGVPRVVGNTCIYRYTRGRGNNGFLKYVEVRSTSHCPFKEERFHKTPSWQTTPDLRCW